MSSARYPTTPVTQRASFSKAVFAEFLESGWMLTLDSTQILIGWGELIPSSPTSAEACAFFAPDFYLESGGSAWRRTPFWDVVDRDVFQAVVAEATSASGNSERFQWLAPQFDGFSAAFSEIQLGFETRGLRKAVPVVYETAEAAIGASRLANILKSLSVQPRQIYIYGFWSLADQEGMIGATPEVLFTQKPGQGLETVALAGTISKVSGADAAERLMRDPKERFEHQIVVEDIKNQLSSIGDVAVGTTAVMELPTLYHLKTRLQSRPQKEQNFADLAALLHPTPALGLAPRALGFSEMRRWDHSPLRGRFGAPFGAVYGNSAESLSQHCLVAIRNIQWQDSQVRLGSGCGIVPDSRLEREWDELKLKRDSVKRMLGV